MSTKNNPGTHDCYTRAAPDEPMFVLLGRDPMAAALVRAWALMRGQAGEKGVVIMNALKCADDMEKWARDAGKGDRIKSVQDLAESLHVSAP